MDCASPRAFPPRGALMVKSKGTSTGTVREDSPVPAVREARKIEPAE